MKNIHQYFPYNHHQSKYIKPKDKPVHSHSQHSSNLQQITLQIHYGEFHQNQTFHAQETNKQIFRKIKAEKYLHQQHSPSGYQPVGLASVDNRQMIDYFLLSQNQKIGRLKNNQKIKVLYANLKDYQRQNINLGDFQFLKCLGKGVSSIVFLVRHRLSCKLYAIKQIRKQYISDHKKLLQVLREQKILREIPNSTFIIKFHASFESQDHLNFLTDFYPGGQLFFHLQSRRLTEQESKVYFSEMLVCLQFLHKNEILYRDLKVLPNNQPQNILVDNQGHLVIADFGLSKICFKQDEYADSYCGSPEYMAPQIVGKCKYSFSVDFYTLGALLYQFTTGLPPFYSKNNDTLQNNILHKKLNFPDNLSLPLRRLLKKILQKDPHDRINNFDQLKRMQWLQGIDWKKIVRKDCKPPITLQLYKSYIHQQFLQIKVQNPYFQHTKYQGLFSFFNYIKPDQKKNFFYRLQERDTLLTNLSKSGFAFSAKRTDGSANQSQNKKSQEKPLKKTPSAKTINKQDKKNKQKVIRSQISKKLNKYLVDKEHFNQVYNTDKLNKKKSSSNILMSTKAIKPLMSSRNNSIKNLHKDSLYITFNNKSIQHNLHTTRSPHVKEKQVISMHTPHNKNKQNIQIELRNLKGRNFCASTKGYMNLISSNSSANLLKPETQRMHLQQKQLRKKSIQKKQNSKDFKKKKPQKSFYNLKLKSDKSSSKIRII